MASTRLYFMCCLAIIVLILVSVNVQFDSSLMKLYTVSTKDPAATHGGPNLHANNKQLSDTNLEFKNAKATMEKTNGAENKEIFTASGEKDTTATSFQPLQQLPIQNHVKDEGVRTNHSLPLQPPYRIVLFGEPRSGSTFNHQLLYALARIKTPPNEKVHMIMNGISDKGSFVSKCHFPEKFKGVREKVEMNDEISIFISTHNRGNVKFHSNFTSKALHFQESANLRSCSLCEVDAYREIFNLTDTEVQHVKDYMGAYEIIRQCCGLQMSKWEQMRLLGCNISEEERMSPNYPHCEDLNKTEAELTMASRPGGITYVGMHAKFNWMKVGDCKRFDKMVMKGAGFNGKEFSVTEENCEKFKGKP